MAPASKSGTATRSSFAEGEGRECLLAGHVPDPDGGVAAAHRARAFERADGERQQIGGERWRAFEVHGLAAAREPLGALDRRVREHGVGRCRGDGEAEARLHHRLVEAGEETAGVGGLELGEGKGVARCPRVVEAAQVVAQAPAEPQLDADAPRSDALGEPERDGLTLGLLLDPCM
jgi:hypothetical protein